MFIVKSSQIRFCILDIAYGSGVSRQKFMALGRSAGSTFQSLLMGASTPSYEQGSQVKRLFRSFHPLNISISLLVVVVFVIQITVEFFSNCIL